jgi:hypothetical protein
VVSPEALLKRVYEIMRVWTNQWRPPMKLIGKERTGAKVRKRYSVGRNPYQRLREPGPHSSSAAAPRGRACQPDSAGTDAPSGYGSHAT